MCNCFRNSYHILLFNIFGISTNEQTDNESNQTTSYQAFLPKININGSFTEIDLKNDNINNTNNPMFIRR